MKAVFYLLFIALRSVSVAFRKSGYDNPSYMTRLKTATWQEDLDQILNVDTPRDARKSLSRDLFRRLNEIASDMVSAIQERDVDRVAPRSLAYGKGVRGIQAFNNQVLSDVIPEFLTKAVPRLVDEGPKIISKLVKRGPAQFVETSKKAIKSVREISQDPSALQYTMDTLCREMRNIIKSTPEGLETPYYEALHQAEDFELRRYDGYSICSTSINTAPSGSTEVIITEPVATTLGFQKLLSYFFGENSVDGGSITIAMTVPILLDSKAMSFVLPRQFNAMSAPIPLSSDVELYDVAGMDAAVKEFSGMVTEGEVLRQKAKLQDVLLTQNINYDPSSFQVLQYNPPYTLPWVRRNEIMVKVLLGNIGEERRVTEDTAKFFTAPEAGD
ncbi:heme-binding protein [archaeon]|nr:MAG: heme-binding protein [archaeon]